MGINPHKQPRGEPKRARERRADAGGNVQPPAPPLNSQKKSRGNSSAKIERLRIKARQSSAGFVALGYAERQARRRALNKTPRKFAVPTSELLQLKSSRVVEVVETVLNGNLFSALIFQAEKIVRCYVKVLRKLSNICYFGFVYSFTPINNGLFAYIQIFCEPVHSDFVFFD